MNRKAAGYLGLLLTEMRNDGAFVELNDRAAAYLISDALGTISPSTTITATSAAELCDAFHAVAESGLLCADNGTDDDDPEG